MDRELSNSIIQKRKNTLYAKIALNVIIIVIIITSLRYALKPTIKASEFYTAIVENGNLEASVTASGIIFPEFEEIKTSPIQSRILKIHHSVGDKILKGTPILSLDTKTTESALQKLTDELNMKKNSVSQLQLQLEKNLITLKTQYEIKKLEVENLKSSLDEEKYLDKIGGGTKEKTAKAELSLKISTLELDQIKQNIENQAKSNKADLLGLKYEINIRQNNVSELTDKLNQATISTENDGVITWINDQIGKNINAGDELVKIANLQSFASTGSISDIHADKLHIGDAVKVQLNETTTIRGEIINVSPTVSNNTIQFKVKLQPKNHPALRANLRVDIYVITSFKQNVIRVKNGPFYKGVAKQTVFVVEAGKLARKEVVFGDSNYEYVQIISGLSKGDKIVTKDMSEYERHHEISIKN